MVGLGAGAACVVAVACLLHSVPLCWQRHAQGPGALIHTLTRVTLGICTGPTLSRIVPCGAVSNWCVFITHFLCCKQVTEIFNTGSCSGETVHTCMYASMRASERALVGAAQWHVLSTICTAEMATA